MISERMVMTLDEIANRHRDHALEAFAHINRVLGEATDVMPSDR